VTPQGTLVTIAGAPTVGGEGGNALDAPFLSPQPGVSQGDGAFYFSDRVNHRICRVTASGTLEVFAGIGAPGYGGDGGAAKYATLSFPGAAAATPDGSLYFIDQAGLLVRKIDPKGVISTVAGNFSVGTPVEGQPATKSPFRNIRGLAVSRAGLLLADNTAHKVYLVDASGTLTAFAGTGTAGYSGDQGPATAARLNAPSAVAVDATGVVYIADSSNFRLRAVSPQGIIATIAGTGVNVSGSGPDGVPSSGNPIGAPNGVLVDPDGNIFLSEFVRVRWISKLTGLMYTVAGDSPVTDYPPPSIVNAADIHFVTARIGWGPGGQVMVNDENNDLIFQLLPPGANRRDVLSGDMQSGPGGATLPLPLVVRLSNSWGLPAAGTERFQLATGAGWITNCLRALICTVGAACAGRLFCWPKPHRPPPGTDCCCYPAPHRSSSPTRPRYPARRRKCRRQSVAIRILNDGCCTVTVVCRSTTCRRCPRVSSPV
jgi:hypothetical protein